MTPILGGVQSVPRARVGNFYPEKGTILRMALDTRLFFVLNNLVGQSQLLDWIIVFLASYLPYLLVAAFLLLLYYSSHSKRDKLYMFWVTTASAFIARFGVTELIRFFYQRPRPFMVYPQIHALFVDNEWSFPSGHATFFFAMAAAIYLYNKKWGIGFFIATLAVTISRIIAGVHYPSDILGGMVIGVLVAYATFYVAEKWRAKKVITA